MNKQTKYNSAIKDLMANDSNGIWNEILDECDGNLDLAFKELISSLAVSFEESPDTTIYRQIWNRLFNFMCCDAVGWSYLKNSKGEYWVDQHGNWHDIDVRFSTDWNSMMSLIDELEKENIDIGGVITSIDVEIGYGYCRIQDENKSGLVDFRSYLPTETWKLMIITDALMQYLLFRDDLTRKKKEEVKSNDLVVIPEAQMAIVRAALQYYKHGVERFCKGEESSFLLHDLVTLEEVFTYQTSIMISKEDRENFCHKHHIDFPIYTNS